MTDEPTTTTTSTSGNAGGAVTTTVPATGTSTTKVEPKPEDKSRSEIPPEVEKALKKANKEAETLRLKLQEYEDSKKSEEQKLTEAKTAAEKEAAEAKQDYLRLKVGTSKGLPPAVAERLRGETEEDMAEDADRLLELIKPGSPSGSADGGNQGKAPEKGDDMNSLLRKAAGVE